MKSTITSGKSRPAWFCAAILSSLSLCVAQQPGEMDPTFGRNLPVKGEVITLAVQSDGKILLSLSSRILREGGRWYGEVRRSFLRIHSNGSYDSGFTGREAKVDSIALQKDGGIVVSGPWTNPAGGLGSGRVLRLNPAGTVDERFAPDLVPMSVKTAVVDPEDRILILGAFASVNGVSRPGFARLKADGSLDASFTPADGTVDEFRPVFEAWWLNPVVRSMAIESNGDIVAGGYYSVLDGTGSAPLLARIRGGEVVSAPAITGHPESKVIFVNDAVEFRVAITSSSVPSFQWQFNGRDIPGATNSVFSLRNVPFMQSGTYRVIVSNAVGRITSEPAVLSVLSPGPLGDWNLRHQFQHATLERTELSGLRAHAWGNGLHVVVGDKGTILTSMEGKSWMRRASGISDSLSAVHYAAGMFIAVGDNGRIVGSTDGITWKLVLYRAKRSIWIE